MLVTFFGFRDGEDKGDGGYLAGVALKVKSREWCEAFWGPFDERLKQFRYFDPKKIPVWGREEMKKHMSAAEARGWAEKTIDPLDGFCDPDDVVARVKKVYSGDYVLEGLLGWYKGGVGVGGETTESTRGCLTVRLLAHINVRNIFFCST